jgi:hypothetical protein
MDVTDEDDGVAEIQRVIEEIPEEDRPVQTYIGLIDRYEFTQEQNGLIGRLAGAMGAVGTIQAVLGGLQIVNGAVGLGASWLTGLSGIIGGLVLVVTGFWVRQAANSLDVVVYTRGSDIHNLMEGLENLTKVYRVQRAWYLAAIGAAVVTVGIAAYQFVTARGDRPAPATSAPTLNPSAGP